ncbi:MULTISPECIES: hypothetical protein [unclassified Cobetia]|uniref:hypothetical protein n=1 Tax=unclassified Cobetia TaxID=2609414 RepID=UPI00159DEA9C|nr:MULTISPECIES: hypothetical protein [unclassified Cobetia]MCO7233351.1 hypothetical protein [Cobetia sp. Dlab-2-AX]MCO7236585.1 hypothetical protein [Cobetia sp. Dlab-2-U]NVN57203.1 hypothetical protein [bacterium Scap17]
MPHALNVPPAPRGDGSVGATGLTPLASRRNLARVAAATCCQRHLPAAGSRPVTTHAHDNFIAPWSPRKEAVAGVGVKEAVHDACHE